MVSEDPSSWQERFEYYLEQDQGGAAYQLAKEVTEGEPANALAWGLRGLAAGAVQNFVEAEYALAEACRLDPTNASYFVQLAEAYAAQGKPDAAIIHADKALAIDPSNLDAIVGKARIAIDREQFGEAIKLLEAAMSRAPGDADLGGLLAATHRDAVITTLPTVEDGTHIWTSQAHIDALTKAAARISRLPGPVAADQAADLRQFAAEGMKMRWDLATPQFYLGYGIGFSIIPCICGYSFFESLGSAVIFGLALSLGAAAGLFIYFRRRPSWELAKRELAGGNFSHKFLMFTLKIIAPFVR